MSAAKRNFSQNFNSFTFHSFEQPETVKCCQPMFKVISCPETSKLPWNPKALAMIYSFCLYSVILKLSLQNLRLFSCHPDLLPASQTRKFTTHAFTRDSIWLILLSVLPISLASTSLLRRKSTCIVYPPSYLGPASHHRVTRNYSQFVISCLYKIYLHCHYK